MSASLTDIERVTGLLGDDADQLESFQAISPSPVIEAVLSDIRFARDSLARITTAHLDALEEFARDALARNQANPIANNLVIGDDFELVDEFFDSGDFELVDEDEPALKKGNES